MRTPKLSQLEENLIFDISDEPITGLKRKVACTNFSLDIVRKRVELKTVVYYFDENDNEITSTKFPAYKRDFVATNWFMGYIDEQGKFIAVEENIEEEVYETSEGKTLISEYDYYKLLFETGINLNMIEMVILEKDDNNQFEI